MEEIWKDIPNFSGYKVSNLGRIKRSKDNYIFKENKNSSGYRIITLTKNKKEYNKSVHRIVAEVFIPNPNNLPQVNHKDGNKMNNNINNLEWCTRSENMIHAYKNKLEIKKGKKVVQFDKNMKIIKIWEKISDAEKKLNITHGKTSMVCNGKRNKTGGYIWRYYEEI